MADQHTPVILSRLQKNTFSPLTRQAIPCIWESKGRLLSLSSKDSFTALFYNSRMCTHRQDKVTITRTSTGMQMSEFAKVEAYSPRVSLDTMYEDGDKP
jgi:hypothetical protein